MVNLANRWRRAPPRARAELIATSWELFSAMLFVSAVVPAAFATPWPAVLMLGGLGLSSLVGGPLCRRGRRGFAAAAALRVVLWLLAATPLVSGATLRVLMATLGFGLMAAGIRHAVYRRMLDPIPREPMRERIMADLRTILGENATVAGIVGGHVLLLFSVAFLRTQSNVVFRAWWEIIPVLAVLGTVGFTLTVRPATSRLFAALEAGPDGDPDKLARGLADARAIPRRLYLASFVAWLLCVSIGILYFQPGPRRWYPADAVLQLGLGALFAFGVSSYQRGWHEDAVAPALALLRRWTGHAAEPEKISLRARMLREFGLPLLFTLALSLLSSLSLFRTLAPDLPWREDFAAISALCASFLMLLLAAGGLFLRGARQLSDPLSALAAAADRVASGGLDDAVPRVEGPIEVVGLGHSIERMRRALARTIAELKDERAGLETNVALRTQELEGALEELKQAQTALIQGERMALIGELVASVAHEIHNPLNAIAGSISSLDRVSAELREMLEAYAASEAQLPAAERQRVAELRARIDLAGALDDLSGVAKVVRSATRRSVEIVSNLKSLARAPAEPIPTDLHEGLCETLSLLRHRLEQSGIEVVQRFGELPEVTCRAGEINQVMMNLLTNAIQAIESHRDLGRESEHAGRIVVETAADDDAVTVTIRDNGPGVPPAIAARIFDPFFSTKGPREGTGLGLSISREIARRHGGSLTLADSAEGGAAFVCRLPVAPPRPVASRPRSLSRGPGSDRAGASRP